MRYLGSVIALLALTASAPAFASDYSTDRHFTRPSVGTTQAAQETRAAPPEARKDARPCDCSCARRTDGERPAASPAEPGRH